MKIKTPQFLSLGAALLLAPLTPILAQSTWQTVDDYTAGQSGIVKGLAAVDNGVVFSAGSGTDLAGIPHAFVRRTLDGGQTWLPVLDLPGNGTATSLAVTVGQRSGLVFATAMLRSMKNIQWNDWVVLRSADAGTTWSPVDVLTAPNFFAYPNAVVEDSAGRVFVGGRFGDTQGRQHFLTRRSLDGGTTWATVDDLAGGFNWATGMAATPTAVFAVGRIANVWSVRRSMDGGSTWTTVDQFQPAAAQLSHASQIAADVSGNLYVAGWAQFVVNKAVQAHWVTRKSTNGGLNWTTVDNYLPPATPAVNAVTVDAFGRVFVTGGYSIGGVSHWITRGSTNGGVNWVLTDDVAGAVAAAAAASDAAGNVFTGGAVSPAGVNHATVRKLVP